MPRVPLPGKVINGYTIPQPLNKGSVAFYGPAEAPDGRKVFFKAYMSPSVKVAWYSAYIAHVKELNRRIGSPELQRFCVHNLEAFEADFGPRTFFQVFEFVEGGHDLGTIIDKLRSNPKSLSWDQRLILAKVLMAGIHQLHEKQIVHADLKPPNIQMLKDPSIKAGFQLKLIDMDFSVLADRKAPWHGTDTGYVGSPRYYSPEHLRKQVPLPASDVFTCGLILYELLAQGHPYSLDEPAEYLAAIEARKASKPRLIGKLADDATTAALVECLHKCLSPNADQRPTALHVNRALNGLGVRPTDIPPPRPPPVDTSDTSAPAPKATTRFSASTVRPLQLVATNGCSIMLNIATPLGKGSLAPLGEDAKYAAPVQFHILPVDDHWILEPASATPQVTLLNGRAAKAPTPLNDGDIICLGSRKSEKTVFRLTVRLS